MKKIVKKAQNGDTLYSKKVNKPNIKGSVSKVKKGDATETKFNKTFTRGSMSSRTLENPKAGENDTLYSKRVKQSTQRYGDTESHDYKVRRPGGVEKGSTSSYTDPRTGKTIKASSSKFKKSRNGGSMKKRKKGY
jgi:hypothetical protein